jgi:hypothetical protein
MELVAVMMRPGPITDHESWEALQDRVRDLAMKDNDPTYLLAACRALEGCASTDNPREAGQFLVKGNLVLRQILDLAIHADGDPWPATVPPEHNANALEVLKDDSLEMWIELAAAELSTGGLD